MRAVILSVATAIWLAGCGLQSAPPPVDVVTKESIGTSTEPPTQNEGHGYRTPPSVSGKPPFVYPVYPPSNEPPVQTDPVPQFNPAPVTEAPKPAPKKAAKKKSKEVTIHASKTFDPSVTSTVAFNLDDILGQLRQGNIAFTVPAEMFFGEDSEVNLVIDTTTTQKELERLAGPGAISSTLLVSKVIVTKLIAPSFEVTPVTPERQALIDGQPTKWQWKLRPTENGKHKVNLSVTAVLKVDGQSVERFIVTFERDIFVHVTIKNRLETFWASNWQWLLGTLVLPLAAWLWHRRRRRA
jgi:hypothetical protein